jgi:glycosyltransferase involved in cell wall biosynthesis
MKRKLKIGIEVQRIFRPKKHGMEVVALELIREIQLLDKHNEYILYARKDEDYKCIKETTNFRIKMFPSMSYFTWEQLALPKKVHADGLDILHSTCNTSSLFLRVPLVLTLHDIIYLETLDFKGTAYQNFGNLYRRFIVPRIVAKCLVIITVSKFEKDVITKKFGLPEDSVKVIYNAVNAKFNTRYSNEILSAFRERLRLPKDFLLFLGNTAPKKNTLNVLKSYLKYRDGNEKAIPIVILDYDRNLVLQYLQSEGQETAINDFIFPGYIESENMPLLYNLCRIFLYPSIRESFGLPILEAMACGAPVVTSNTSSMPEVAGDAAIFVNPFDYVDIKNKIVEILENEDLQISMRERGIQRAAGFTWKAAAEQLISVYQSFS